MSQTTSPVMKTIPQKDRKRYERAVRDAPTSYRAAVKLKCLDCCCWHYPAAKSCDIESCSLWLISGKLFSRAKREE